jgi:hypothetical protein
LDDKRKGSEEEVIGGGGKERRYVISAIKDGGEGEVPTATDGGITVSKVEQTKDLGGDKRGALEKKKRFQHLAPRRPMECKLVRIIPIR